MRAPQAVALYLTTLLASACATNPRPEVAPDALSFRLEWAGAADLDLRVRTPLGERIWFAEPRARSGGILNTDCNVDPDLPCENPHETVSWGAGQAPPGVYQYWVCLLHPRGTPLPVAFTVAVLQDARPIGEKGGRLDRPGAMSEKWELTYRPGLPSYSRVALTGARAATPDTTARASATDKEC